MRSPSGGGWRPCSRSRCSRTRASPTTPASACASAACPLPRLRQLDDTARVFYAPVSEEVARFVGVETLVAGRVLGREAGVTAVEVGGRVLEVAAVAAAGARVRVGIRPEDVTLTVAEGARVASSARNALDGTVTRVSASTHATHVLVDVGFPLVAAVTARSVNELGLRPGARVRAVFKASAAHLIPA